MVPEHLILLSTFTEETKTPKLSKYRVLVNITNFFLFVIWSKEQEIKNHKAEGTEGTIYVAWEKVN